jgi:hypothetical protein
LAFTHLKKNEGKNVKGETNNDSPAFVSKTQITLSADAQSPLITQSTMNVPLSFNKTDDEEDDCHAGETMEDRLEEDEHHEKEVSLINANDNEPDVLFDDADDEKEVEDEDELTDEEEEEEMDDEDDDNLDEEIIDEEMDDGDEEMNDDDSGSYFTDEEEACLHSVDSVFRGFHDQQGMKRIILEIRQNKSEEEFDPCLNIYDDASAILLGEALKMNDRLHYLFLTLGSRLTSVGAQSLVEGLRCAPVTEMYITINHGSKNSPVTSGARIVAAEAVGIVQDLMLEIDLDDDLAERIGTTLTMQRATTTTTENDQTTTNKIQKLQIWISSSMTIHGARKLAKGFAGVCQLVLLRYGKVLMKEEVMRIIFQQAVIYVQELVYSPGLRDYDATMLGEAVMEGGQSMALESLSMAFGSKISCSGAAALAKGIRQSRLVRLKLEDTADMQITEGVGDILFEHGIRDILTIRDVFSDLSLTTNATAALFHCLPRLESLDIWQNSVGHVCDTELIRNLSCASQITFLSIRICLSESDMVLFCDALPHLPLLTTLTIAAVLTCEEGNALVRDFTVTFSDLESRNIRPAMAELMMTTVANHPALVELEFYYVIDIGYMGLEMIGHHLPNVKLKKLAFLELREFVFDVKNPTEEFKRAHHRACQALVAGVRSNDHLRELKIDLPSVYREEIDCYLELNKLGRCVLQSENGVSTAGMCHLLARCGENAAAIYYFLREQPQLVRA